MRLSVVRDAADTLEAHVLEREQQQQQQARSEEEDTEVVSPAMVGLIP